MGSFLYHITFLTGTFVLLSSVTVENKKNSHPLYIAVTEINFNNSDKLVTIICKTFADDLALALQKKYHETESFDDPPHAKRLSFEMEEYIKNHLQLKINGRSEDFVFTNFKKEDNTIWNYFRINNIDEVKKFEVTDNIFYELYADQIQIIYITVNGNRKSSRIANPNSNVAFDF